MSPLTGLAPAGELRHRVTIIRPVGTQSATGGLVEDTQETFAASLPASITSSVLGESLRAGSLMSSATHIVTIRYVAGVKPWMRVTFESRTFEILAVIDPGERHIELQLACAEVQ